MHRLRVFTLSLVCLLQFGQARSHGEEIGFLEQFAIGGNRSVALAQLVPGRGLLLLPLPTPAEHR